MASAIAKLTDELQKVSGDKYVSAVKNAVFEMLCDMCNKSENFEKIIAESPKSLNDCLLEVVKGVGTSLSGIEAYRRVARFYCPEADVVVDLRLILLDEKQNLTEKQNIISIFDVL